MKALEGYLYIVKMKFMASMVYRFEFFASILASVIMMFSTVFLWKSIYHAFDKVDGLTESQMVTYAILSSLLGIIFNVNVERVMFERILQGDIAIDFIRPTNMILCFLAEDIGTALSFFMSKFIPMLLFVSIFFYQPVPKNAIAFLLFVVSSLLSFGIMWMISAIIGLIYMKMIDLGSIGFVKDAILALLSGSIIPIWFFPDNIKLVLSFLPFQYTYQTPLGIYIGKYSPYEALVSMLIQGIWICLLLMAFHMMWERFRKNVLVQGG